jgi:hypothetical protein
MKRQVARAQGMAGAGLVELWIMVVPLGIQPPGFQKDNAREDIGGGTVYK